jgi:peptidoglycan/xylan/chitin deacetylase (PgdA/CDA1 family)
LRAGTVSGFIEVGFFCDKISARSMAQDYSAKTNIVQNLIAVIASVLLFAAAAAAQSPARRTVAITIDDMPGYGGLASMQSIVDRLIRTLKAERAPAIGFVNEGKLFAGGTREVPARTDLLRRWLDAGYDLGNHTYSHVGPGRVTFDVYAQDLIRGETVTRGLLNERGRSLKYFRHPELKTGPTVLYKQQLDELLAKRGYTVAPVTVDNNDFIFATAYSKALRARDKKLQARIADAYIEYMEIIFEHFERLSRRFLGREMSQTLLLHASDLNADTFGRLAKMLRGRGYTFVSLDDALADKAYSLPEAQTERGLSWLHRWMLARNMPLEMEPLQPSWITSLGQNDR